MNALRGPRDLEGCNAALVYRLRGLSMACAVLHVGAHPDDEESGLLSYFAHKHAVRVVYWSATRGEGGQNRLNAYTGEALGIYRTWESQAARGVDGAECLFGPFIDFGYSKNALDTFTKWGRTALVREIVRAIRLVQPHVIIARWSGTARDEHGQHHAVGQAVAEAFEAAGDSNQFPELRAQGLAAWQPRKLYCSTTGDFQPGQEGTVFGRRDPSLERDGFVRINTGEFDPTSASTYEEQAWTALNQHRTQAMGLAPMPGTFFHYLAFVRSSVPTPAAETSIFDGFDPTLTGLLDYPGPRAEWLARRLEGVKTCVRAALEQLRPHDPLGAAAPLLECLAQLREVERVVLDEHPDQEASRSLRHYLRRNIGEVEDLAAWCLGIRLECLSQRARLIPGRHVRVASRVWNHRGAPVERASFEPVIPDGWGCRPVEPDCSTLEAMSAGEPAAAFEVSIPQTAELSCPYWLAEPPGSYAYHWPDGEPAARPFGPALVEVACRVVVGGQQITLRAPAVRREAFPGGWRALPIAVIPPISLHPERHRVFLRVRTSRERRQVRSKRDLTEALMFLEHSFEKHQLKLVVVARNNSDGPVTGHLVLEVPPGWQVAPEQVDLMLTKADEATTATFTVSVPADVGEGQHVLRYRIRHAERDYSVVLSPVRMGAPGLAAPPDGSTCISEEFVLAPSHVIVHLIGAAFVTTLRYAYVRGATEAIPETLEPFGVSFHFLTNEDLAHGDLGRFDVIVVGPNAYLVREDLRRNAARVLEYVRGGGTLIVQYQAYGYDAPGLAPYPFRYSHPHDRVTDAGAPITFLQPDHLVFRVPNTIGLADFDGWVRDRGLYFFGQWDARYRALLACADPGEPAREGGLVECQYGRGTYVYIAYSFFKQLPAAVPGAFRLFANLLALPAARARERMAFLSQVSWFSTLDTRQLEQVVRAMDEQLAEDGESIRRGAGPSQDVVVVYRGAVEVVMVSNGSERVSVVGAGTCLGALGTSGPSGERWELRAHGPTHVLVLAEAQFRSLVHQDPEIAMKAITFLAHELARPS